MSSHLLKVITCLLNNLLTRMNEYNFSDADINIVMDFFDKSWNLYVNNVPMLAVIPEVENQTKILIDDNFFDFTKNFNSYFDGTNECFRDCQTSEVIDTSDAIFITLPKYNELIYKICNRKINTDETEKKCI